MEGKDNNESPSLDPNLAPLLLFGHDDDAATFMYSVPTRAPLPTDDDMDGMMRAHRRWTTAQGWLLMARRGSPSPCTFLWDPFTGRRIATTLFSPKAATGCVSCHAVVPRTPAASSSSSTSTTRCSDIATPETNIGWSISTSSPGRFTTSTFYTDFTDHVVVLEFSPEPVFTVTAVDGDHRCQAGYTRRTANLVESNGELHHVFSHPIICSRIVARVSVYKLISVAAQKQRSAWVKVDSLGGRVFFVGTNSLGVGASLDAKETGLKGNCIYYWGINGKVLCVYDMERGTTVVINPGANLPYDQSPEVLMPTR
uniref:KIB1-4 beta-propeller domain-containing protein n=1 Tax=Oryza punctata TaxID=4537 RepID=A0A0E0M0U1_ORYPU